MSISRCANSLVARIIVFGILLVLIGTVTRYFALAGYIRDNLIQITTAQQASLAEAVAQNIDDKLEDRLAFLKRVAMTMPLDLVQEPVRLHNWLKERAELLPLFSLGLLVTDPDGTVITDYPSVPGRSGLSLAQNADFRRVMKGESGIGNPTVGTLTHKILIPMGVPVKDDNGNIRAIMIGLTALPSPGFLDFLSKGQHKDASNFSLIAPKSKLIVDFSGPIAALEPAPASGVDPFLDRALNGFRGSGITHSKGIEEIAAIASISNTNWFIIARVPTSVALAAVDQTKSYLFWHLLLTIAIALPAIGLFVTWILRPLFQAADKAEKMAREEMPLQELPVVRNDEVGHLTAAFNKLISKLASSQNALRHMAYHDALTGLPNRSLLVDRLRQALARSKRNQSRLAVLFLDLDGFKQINDTMGHDAGDEVLRVIARRLSSVVREVDTLARIGGDEFILLATDLAEEPDHGIGKIADKCIQMVTEPLKIQDVECNLGVSIGIALCCGKCEPECLIAAADKAMYESKQMGGGCYRVTSFCKPLHEIETTN
ncbi:GGDEF domain-containing protein [Halothiobacillus sp.]|uniref:GGDEF domain-containing protein n=1 Tax=Halothiobacillus sp. TaxID=1891311 RepID=UPI00262274D9|nr:GGDEF domain-containing protein [Halothiobacillus sp.]